MAQAIRGAEARFRMKEGATWGTLPSGNWQGLNFYSETIADQGDLVDDPELGSGRFTAMDTSEPGEALSDVTGQVVIPLDINQIGWWLKGLMGAPVTTGTAPNYTHVFTSGSPAAPFFGMEFGLVSSGSGEHKQVPSVAFTGIETDFTDAEGFYRMTVSCIGRSSERSQTSAAGTPVAPPARAKVPATRAILKINGVTAGNILGGTFSYQTNAAGERYVDGHGFFGEVDSGLHTARLAPRIRLRTGQLAVLDLFDGTTQFSAALEYVLDANRSLILAFPVCKAPRTRPTIDGPGGLEVPVNIGAFQTATAAMMTATLNSQVAVY